MNIFCVANARIPTEKAHGIQIMKMCEAFGNLGHKVVLVVPRRRNTIKYDPFDYYKVKKSFTIKKVSTLDLIGIIPRVGALIEAVSFALSAALFLHFKKPNFIYARDEITLSFLSSKQNLYWESHRGQYSPAVRITLKKVKGLVVISKGLRDFYVSKGVVESTVLVAHDAVDINEFGISSSKEEARRALGLPQDKKIVMYTGHLYDWKGAAVLLEAARNIKFPISNIQFVFVGGTDFDLKKFKERAQGLDNVLLIGQKPHEEIPKYLAAADVLVLPNSGKFEISRTQTSPLKLFEYMAAGRPIIASDLPSIREILNERNAVFFKADDSSDLAGKIESLLTDEKLQEQIAQEEKRIVKQYTWQSRATKILEFINSKL